ncbi:Gfo/Idh/MocA family protein [Paenibacillus lutrae]|uniref:Gfo/Idh/MocA family oxidoreductase n=1 Tax=Paenibacillus lutrae TaxID=2078573 RepID=A0A7X3FK79_9BACL|nr:Gfo/Idh/MocA family oxidoreductase [Paenibacillus lutrae]MVP01009.1 gfo/Idh/MocA family oxidoreductase [Paenibacillus lutrae]
MNTSSKLKLGIIGLDTSHAAAFTELLSQESHRYHVQGGIVTAAYPGGSGDFELSRSRVQGFTDELRQKYGVQIVDSPEEVARQCDAILLESVDGRVHLEQFRRIAGYGKPVFIDKPFTVDAAEAAEIIRLAEESAVPVMSSSALRFAEGVRQALAADELGQIIGADCYGPMELQPTQPGLFWYGIHSVEMLYTFMGPGCSEVTAAMTEHHDVVTGTWKDGRIGTIRGNRCGNMTFGAMVHREQGSRPVDVYAHDKPYYASLLEQIMPFFHTGVSPVTLDETWEIIRFIEAANESRLSGKPVRLRS